MSGRILIVDSIATNRILLKVKLSATFYEILQASDRQQALTLAHSELPDLILLDISNPGHGGLGLLSSLKQSAETAHIPVIVISEAPSAELLMDALRGGAEDVIVKPIDEQFLLARMRSVLRAADIASELNLRDSTSRSFGIIDPVEPANSSPARVILVGGNTQISAMWHKALQDRMDDEILPMTRDQALAEAVAGKAPDLFVISSDFDEPGSGASLGLRLMSELRSRSATRHCAVVVVLPESEHSMAGIALDLGASDLLLAPFGMDEMAHRLTVQIERKRQTDRLRSRVEDGLKMAMTDPLTGLFNRRYALSHLSRVIVRSKSNGRNFALMLLDLDRFKQVNDRFGHQCGDKVLQVVAERLTANLRSVDLVARVGGEEFLIVLPDTDAEDARRTAKRLCRTIESTPIEGTTINSGQDTVEVSQTASIGVVIGGDYLLPSLPDPTGQIIAPTLQDMEDTIDRLLARADRALYRAKSSGRNGVMFSKTAAA